MTKNFERSLIKILMMVKRWKWEIRFMSKIFFTSINYDSIWHWKLFSIIMVIPKTIILYDFRFFREKNSLETFQISSLLINNLFVIIKMNSCRSEKLKNEFRGHKINYKHVTLRHLVQILLVQIKQHSMVCYSMASRHVQNDHQHSKS